MKKFFLSLIGLAFLASVSYGAGDWIWTNTSAYTVSLTARALGPTSTNFYVLQSPATNTVYQVSDVIVDSLGYAAALGTGEAATIFLIDSPDGTNKPLTATAWTNYTTYTSNYIIWTVNTNIFASNPAWGWPGTNVASETNFMTGGTTNCYTNKVMYTLRSYGSQAVTDYLPAKWQSVIYPPSTAVHQQDTFTGLDLWFTRGITVGVYSSGTHHETNTFVIYYKYREVFSPLRP
jgi:hypothetical protein